MPRRLNLHRETLTALTTDELAEVAGAAEDTYSHFYCVLEEVERIKNALTPGPVLPPTFLCH